MTSQQTKAIRNVNDQLAAERDEADQAAREQPELDAISVYYAVQVKLAEGRTEEARAIVAAWRASKKGI